MNRFHDNIVITIDYIKTPSQDLENKVNKFEVCIKKRRLSE